MTLYLEPVVDDVPTGCLVSVRYATGHIRYVPQI